MSKQRLTASTITDADLDALYENATKGWRRGDIWKRTAQDMEADRDRLLSVIERARALHPKYKDSETCQHDGETWPCPTLAALEEQPAPAAEVQHVVVHIQPDPTRITEALRDIRRHGGPPRR